MQIPDEVRKSVCFILYNDGQGLQLAGTGFFIGIPSSVSNNSQFIYVATAKHVITALQSRSKDAQVWLRINKRDGGSSVQKVPISSWKYSEDSSVDIAVVPVVFKEEWGFDYRVIPVSVAATEEVLQKQAIGVGDELFFPGLFTSHVGKKKNIPIIRTGVIAAMPEEPVSTKLGDMQAYLIEARSIGGLSGSPVFVFLPVGRVVEGKVQMSSSMYLLGVMHGHWDIPNNSADIVVYDDVSRQSVNMGIGIVVPVQKVLEILEQTDLAQKRKENDAKLQKSMMVEGPR